MVFSHLKRIAHGNALRSSSLTLSSSSTPAQAVASPLNDSDAASVKGKGKLSRIFGRRGKRGYTDATGDVAATPSNSESPVLQSNKTSTTSSQLLANAQTMTIKGSPDNNNLAGTLSENKTANATVILDIVKDICEVLDKVPYVKVVAGLATTAITIIEAVNACKEEWDKVKGDLIKVRDIVFEFRYGRDDSAPLPDDVKAAFRELESCLKEVLDAVIRYQDVSAGRLALERSSLKAEATSCVERIDMAVKVFQMKILVGTRLVGDQTHLIVEKILTIVLSTQQSPTPSSSLNLNVLACPAPSQYFTGRESDLRKLSRMLAAPVVTLFSTSSHALSAFVRSFDHSSRFTAIFLDASSVETLSMGLKVIVHNIKANDSAHQSPLLVLENADPSLELDQYLPYSLHNPILITSTNQAVSCFASPACEFELPDSMDQWAAGSLCRSIERAFASLLHVVTIVAKGGTGKTQLVLRFVSEDPSRFMHVWFFDATSDATLAADFKKFGKVTGISESVNDVRDFLGRMQEDWLLIFDNADDPKVELSKYIPRCNHGNIIITSRLAEVNQMASPGAHLDFSDLEQSEAVNLLLQHAHQNSDNNNKQLSFDIVKALGCQALAVATAGAYIASNPTCDLSNYLSRFNQKRTELLNYKMRSLDDYQKTVFSAFQLSFDQLSSSTKLFMQICAFFHHTAIPVELFYRAATFTGDDLQLEEKEKTSAVEELKHFLSLFTHKESWGNSIDELSRLSLTIYDTDAKTFSFHSIIHICIQETIIDKDRICHIALLLFAYATPDDITDMAYQFRRRLIAHADYIHQNDFFTILLYKCLGRIFSDAGMWMKAEGIWQNALVHYKHYYGEHHYHTLTSESNLAQIYMQLGQFDKAEILEQEVLKLSKEVLGEHHPDILTSESNLAQIYMRLGQFNKAEILGQEVFKLDKEVLGEYHPDTLISESNLAQIYMQLGQFDKAEILGQEVLKLRKEVLGEHHPDTLTSESILAQIYMRLGQFNKAEILGQEVLKLRKEVLGEHHPDTLTSESILAQIYMRLGQFNKAEILGQEVLKLRKEVLGEHHPDTLISEGNLAQIYMQLGQFDKAEILGQEVLKLYKEVLGEHHPHTLTFESILAQIYMQLGQFDKAEILGQEVLKLYKEVLGEHHPHTLTFESILAQIYMRLRQFDKAEISGQEVLKLRKKVLGEYHPDTLISEGDLAQIYMQLGQFDKAEILGQEVLKLHNEVLGEHHPHTLTSESNLAQIYMRLGQFDKAEILEQEVLKLRKEVLGEHHPDTLISKSNLAQIYMRLGQFDKAEILGQEVLKLHKEVLGEHHPDTLTSESILAQIYMELGQFDKAEMLR